MEVETAPSASSASPAAATGSISSPAGFPIRTKVFRRIVEGVPTDFSFSLYTDQTLIFVTQLGTAGTIVAATQDAAFDGTTTFSTSILLGKRDEPLIQLCARQMVEIAGAAGYQKPMLVCLGLKQHSLSGIKQIVQEVRADNIWS